MFSGTKKVVCLIDLFHNETDVNHGKNRYVYTPNAGHHPTSKSKSKSRSEVTV